MADKRKPENKEIVERIRLFEQELFTNQSFKVYRNYHVPEKFVKESKKELVKETRRFASTKMLVSNNCYFHYLKRGGCAAASLQKKEIVRRSWSLPNVLTP